MQLKDFERFVNISLLITPLSRHFHHFSVITGKQCCVLNLLRNPHCYFESILLIPYIFDKQGKMVTGRQFSTMFRSFFLKTVITSAFFNSEGNIESNIELMKLKKTNSEKVSRLSLQLFSPVYHFLDKLFCYLDYGSLPKSYFLFQK